MSATGYFFFPLNRNFRKIGSVVCQSETKKKYVHKKSCYDGEMQMSPAPLETCSQPCTYFPHWAVKRCPASHLCCVRCMLLVFGYCEMLGLLWRIMKLSEHIKCWVPKLITSAFCTIKTSRYLCVLVSPLSPALFYRAAVEINSLMRDVTPDAVSMISRE